MDTGLLSFLDKLLPFSVPALDAGLHAARIIELSLQIDKSAPLSFQGDARA